MIITNENYFSKEAELEYFGSTQFKNFRKCEAMTMAKINGEYEEEKSVALLVGGYVDAHFEGTLDLYAGQNPDIFTKGGDLKSDYKHANYIIERIERDEMFMKYMSGKKQVIMTGEWLGTKWKTKIDSYHEGKAIVDLKIMKDFEPVWVDDQGKISFVEAWGYDIQGAIYRKIEGNDLPFIIAGATKEKPEPDLSIMEIMPEDLATAENLIAAYLPRFIDVKAGLVEPRRCEQCPYCRRTKKLTKVISYKEL